MDYDSFTDTYKQKQLERIGKSLQTIGDQSASSGRVVPDTEALVIGSGRRIKMAVMFLDICNFSRRPSENIGEQNNILFALNLFFTEMVRIAEDYGGTVEKNTGDGLMAYFEDGSGQPPEGGCKRAVACSLTMMRTARMLLNHLLIAVDIEALDFRVGIDYGFVTIGRLGAPRRFNAIVAIGTTANVANKMLNFAVPNQIIIGDSVREQLPITWLRYVRKSTDDTGWIYRQSRLPYPFYEYFGRWIS